MGLTDILAELDPSPHTAAEALSLLCGRTKAVEVHGDGWRVQAGDAGDFRLHGETLVCTLRFDAELWEEHIKPRLADEARVFVGDFRAVGPWAESNEEA